MRLNIKPLSANEIWQGRRFKSPKYKVYEKTVLAMLPAIKVPSPPLKVHYRFGFSNVMSDWDNPIKGLQDILQKKYGFNDKDIYFAIVEKVIVKKGFEFIEFELSTFNPKSAELDRLSNLF